MHPLGLTFSIEIWYCFFHIKRTKYIYNPRRLAMRAKFHKLWSISKEWIFRSENCDAATIFGQKFAAWPQGQKKNCVKLCSNRKAPNDRKPPKEEISGVVSEIYSFGVLSAPFGGSIVYRIVLAFWQLPFGSGIDSSFYYEIDTPQSLCYFK